MTFQVALRPEFHGSNGSVFDAVMANNSSLILLHLSVGLLQLAACNAAVVDDDAHARTDLRTVHRPASVMTSAPSPEMYRGWTSST